MPSDVIGLFRMRRAKLRRSTTDHISIVASIEKMQSKFAAFPMKPS